MSEAIIHCQQLSKRFIDGQLHVEVLKQLDFTVPKQAKIAILGSSGSGKSTLLHLLGGLDMPSSGEVFIAGEDINRVSEKQRCRMRNQYLGFVYQFHHLLPEFNALENVCMPLLIAGMGRSIAHAKAMHLLEKVGLAERALHKPGQLSGGEKQRVAIARALVTEPACVLADEPTGNLDQNTAQKVLEIMLQLNEELKTALVMVTHDLTIAARMQQTFTLENGVLR
jgi:lipoprotein-releasing system ATP-binding protein